MEQLPSYDAYRFLAVHISSLHIDLTDVIRTLAARHAKAVALIETSSDPAMGRASSRWILVTGDEAFLRSPQVRAHAGSWKKKPRQILWTDDYSNLLQVLR